MDDASDFDDWSELYAPMPPSSTEHLNTVLAQNPPQLDPIQYNLFSVVMVLKGDARRGLAGTFANELASTACFTRAVRHHRAATALAVTGYYTEVDPLLRSAYEASTLARMLAKEPSDADRWLNGDTWFPDRQVRRWISDFLGADAKPDFDRFYRYACDATHPTSKATLRSIDVDDDGWFPRLRTEHDAAATDHYLDACVAGTWFTCAALRNSLIDEAVLPPNIRQGLRDAIDRSAAHFDMAVEHPDVDWDAANKVQERVVRRLTAIENLDDTLAHDPRSWRNLAAPE